MEKLIKKTHDSMRMIYLTGTICVLPLSILHLHFNSSYYLDRFPGAGAGLVLGCGIFWSIFYIIFEQRYFPESLSGAAVTLTAFFSNATSAVSLSSADIYYGAYSVFISALAAQSVYFTVIIILFLIPRKRERYFYYQSNYYLLLLAGFAVSAWLLLFYFHEPVIIQFQSESGIIQRIFYISAFVFYAVSDCRNMLRSNMFQYESGESGKKRDRILEKWALPVSLGTITSILAGFIIIMILSNQGS